MMRLVMNCEAEDRRYEIISYKHDNGWLSVKCYISRKVVEGSGHWAYWELCACLEFERTVTFIYYPKEQSEWFDHFNLCQFVKEAFEFINNKYKTEGSSGVYHEWRYRWYSAL